MNNQIIFGEMLPGLQIIEHTKHKDSRGDFCELWKINHDSMRGDFRQLNIASSTRDVLRGMHRQNQSKLVMPVYGSIFDVALDPDTGKWFGIFLDNTNALLIPPQYAHGYLVLSTEAIVQYVVDAPYNKAAEEHFAWNKYGIDWPLGGSRPHLSQKDSE
jgi:dTDP-4-dehydrorhamnose 3,5-epimerase